MTRVLAIALSLTVLGLAAADEDKLTEAQQAELAQYFGFGPMQIYKIKPGISNLKLADLNGDGRKDVVLWNSHQSRFELFYQPDPNAPAAEGGKTPERNEIPDRGNLRRENVPVAYRVASLDIADLTGDGRPDLVFFGEPREVVILPGLAAGGFGPPVSMRAPDGEPRGSALVCGDFNHDGRADVALLGKIVLQIFLQKPEGGLAKPVRIVHGIQDPGLMLRADINGDGRDDLAIGSDDDQYGVYVCLQDSDGMLSSLRRIKIPALRSMTFARAKGGDDLYAIEAATGHLKHYRWMVAPETGGVADWPQRLYSYPFKLKSRRIAFAVGDLTGDGLVDCVTADEEGAQLILFKGTDDGLSAGTAFPALMKTTGLSIADVNGDGHAELLSVSAEERTLGISTFTDGRVTFPAPLSIRGEPLAVTAGPLKTADKQSLVACLVRQRPPGARSAEGGEEESAAPEGTKLLVRLIDGATQREVQSWECAPMDDPSGLRLVDLNQDGLNDAIIFSRFASPQVFLQTADGKFQPMTGPETREAVLKGARRAAFCIADVTGNGRPEALVAQKGLARALVAKAGQWHVVDQYNPESADADITGLATLPGEPGSPTIVMYDRKDQNLLVLKRREDKAYAVVQSMPVGNFDLSAMAAIPVGGEGKQGLILADAEKLALLTPGEVAPTLLVRHSYETDVKDAYLADAEVGDLNHDGVRDVVAVDMRKAGLEILTTLPDGALVRVMRFQVFQGKRFAGEPTSYGEPHEVLIGDVTGDKFDDIVLLVHNRLIVYPSQ